MGELILVVRNKQKRIKNDLHIKRLPKKGKQILKDRLKKLELKKLKGGKIHGSPKRKPKA